MVDSTPSRPAASLLLAVLGLILMVPGALDMIAAAVGGHEIPILAIVTSVSGLLLFVVSFFVYLQTKRRDSRMAQFIWQRGDGLAPLAESRGVNATALFAIPFVIFFAVIMQVLIYDDIPILIPIAVGALISAVTVASLARSRVIVQSDSVLLGIPSGPMMGRLPLDKMLSIRLRGRYLRVVLKEKANPLSSRTQRILILGNPTPIATAIQAIGVSRGYDFSIENIEIDAALLKSVMKAMQEGEGLRTTIDEEYLEHTSYPETISILLAIAGISALLSTMVLLAIDRAIADDIGRHIAQIGCCYVLEALLGVLILSGAVMARRRRRYRFVVASAVLATINILGIISIIVGIVSLVMLRKCADEFKD